MHIRLLSTMVAVAAAAALGPPIDGLARQAGPRATFRSGVDLVSVAAVVRDHNGRVVKSLTAPDFLVVEDGRPRPILGLDADDGSPSAVALLVDASGSMRLGSSQAATRQLANAILTELRQDRDRVALMAFDSRLMTLRSFTGEFDEIRHGLREIESFGATSLYDAIAGAAGEVAKRTRQRRAVVVFTDESDNASAFSPAEVARIASTIDVPVYVFVVGKDQDAQARADGEQQSRTLMEIAHATGGDYYPALSAAQALAATTALVGELRYQYLIAFEPTTGSGLRRLHVRMRDDRLRVRARMWYSADEPLSPEP